MQTILHGHLFKNSRHSRFLLLTLVLTAAPTQAQWFGWPAGSPTPATPAAPQPPVPAADLELWLKNAQKAADDARAAQKKGNQAGRNAAILDTLKWTEKVASPHNVPDASRLAALEIVGHLARDMNTWEVTFKQVEAGTLLVMIEVRAKAIAEKVPGVQKTPIQIHLGEIGAAQGYSYVAFDNFSAVALNPDTEISQVKLAAERAIPYIPANNPRSASPIFDRMLTLKLSAEEQKLWQNRRAMHVLRVESTGEEHDAALTLIKTQVFAATTPAAIREELARALEKAVFGEEAAELYAAMLARPNLDGPTQSHWLSLRGERHVADSQYAEAAADYELAAQAAPAGSLQRDEALWSNAWVRLLKLNSKGDVLATVAPTLAGLATSPRLDGEKRYRASTHLLAHYFQIKDYTGAQKLVARRKELAGDNLPRQIEADMELLQVYLGQNQLEAAVDLWTVQPYSPLMLGKTDWGSAKFRAKDNLLRSGSTLYQAVAQAKKFELAQKIVDDPDSARIFSTGDYQLLRADLAVQKGDYPEALTILRALLATVHTPQDKAKVNAFITNIEKRQAAAVTP